MAPQHVAALKAVLVVAHTLANSLGSSWSFVLDTLDHVDVCLKRRGGAGGGGGAIVSADGAEAKHEARLQV